MWLAWAASHSQGIQLTVPAPGNHGCPHGLQVLRSESAAARTVESCTTLAAARAASEPISCTMLIVLAAGRAYSASGHVVCGELGTAVNREWLSYEFHPVAASAGAPSIRLHDGRHTVNSLMAAAGVPPHIRAGLPVSGLLSSQRKTLPSAVGRDAVPVPVHHNRGERLARLLKAVVALVQCDIAL